MPHRLVTVRYKCGELVTVTQLKLLSCSLSLYILAVELYSVLPWCSYSVMLVTEFHSFNYLSLSYVITVT